MTKTARAQQFFRLDRIAAATIAALISLAAWATSAPNALASPIPTPSGPYVVLDLSIDKGTVTPTAAALQVKAGQPVVLRVTANEEYDVHVGSIPELRFGIHGLPAPEAFQFSIDVPGQFDVKAHCDANACGPTHPPDTTIATIQVQPSPTIATTPAPTDAAPRREPCELLSQSIAQVFAGDDAVRQPSIDGGCSYRASTRSVLLTIGKWPPGPESVVNHFGVIRPENRIPGKSYEAYWFAIGEELLVVKDSLLLGFKVSDNPYSHSAEVINQRQAEDIALADLIFPRVG